MTADHDQENGTKAPRPRHIVDGQGRAWTVRELHGSTYDRRATISLVFERDEVIRRVRNFPKDWYTWSDEDLYKLSEGY